MPEPDLILRRRNRTKSGRQFCSHLIDTPTTSNASKTAQFDTLYASAVAGFPSNGKFTATWVKKVMLKVDEIWFNDELCTMATKMYGGIDVYISIDDPKFSGFIEESIDKISFHLNRQLVMALFENGDTGYHSGGLLCKDRLTCLLHVVVHEMVHIALTICDRLKHHDDTQHHGKVFKRVTKRLFGHTDAKHGLILGLNHEHDLDTIRKTIYKGQDVRIYLNEAWTPGSIVNINRTNVDVQIHRDPKNLYSVHTGLIEF